MTSSVHAAIDIGTNSLHLLVARLTSGGGIEILTRERESVRLGSGSADMDRLSPEAMDRGIAALRRFRQVADAAGADITAVATSAVREADNRDEFIRRAQEEAGIAVDVISGVEEARLIHLGILQSVPVFDQQILMCDIGGGSTELLVGKGGHTLEAMSLKIGAIRLTERFFPNGDVRPKAVVDCRSFVRSYLAPASGRLAHCGHDIAVGSSGTITTIAALVEWARGKDPTRGVNAVIFGPDELRSVIERLLGAGTSADRRRINGLDTRRADIIVGGALLLEGIFDTFGVTAMMASEYALREGLFFDRYNQQTAQSLAHLADIRRESVARLLERYPDDQEHVQHSTKLALSLFDELAASSGLGPTERELLEFAGLLHNVGLFISHAAHHKHSYYVIRNTDRLVGFTDREIEILAQVARYHRKSEPSARHPEHAALSPADRHTVSVLAGLLRIGIALDRGHRGHVRGIGADLTADALRLTIQSTGDVELERYAVDQRKGLLERELGRQIHTMLT